MANRNSQATPSPQTPLGPVGSEVRSPRQAERPVEVLINFTLRGEFLSRIEGVGPRVRAQRAYLPLASGDEERPDAWRRLEGEALDNVLSNAEIVFTFWMPIEWLDKAPNLRWIQLASAGSDHFLRAGLFDKRPDILLTTASGVHEIPISEHIIAGILHFAHKLNTAVRQQEKHKWDRYVPGEAFGKTVCMVGYGPIARRSARLMQVLGMRVLCVRGSIVEQQPGFEAVERFYPPDELNAVLSRSDYVVIAAPRTPRTERMIGPEQIDAMKPSAVLVNISRGALVDEAALIEALQSGKIAGAALDVFDQEPLPESSPLWDLPNVLVTPHVAGSNPNYDARATDLFCENLARYLRGESLRNLVDVKRGY